MDSIDISQHTPALMEIARHHRIPVTTVIDRILAHGIEREYEVFDWSPASLQETEPASVETLDRDSIPAGSGERQSA